MGIKESNKDTVQEKYCIFNYCKKHPSAAIAAGSGMIAVFTFCINMILLVWDQISLSYWGWSLREIEWNPSNWFYFVLMGLLLNAGIYLVQNRAYSRLKEDWLILCTFWSLKIRLQKLKAKGKQYENDKEKTEAKKLQKEMKEAQKEINKEYRSQIGLFFKYSIPGMMFILIGEFIMFTSLGGLSTKTMIVLYVVITSLLLVLVYLSLLLSMKRTFYKSVRNCSYEEMSLLTDILFEDYIEDREKRMDSQEKTKFTVSDEAIKGLCRALAFFLISMLLSLSLLSHFSQRNKKDFSLFQDEKGIYVITYQTKESVYLNEIEYNGTQIVIDTKSKRVLKRDDINYYNRYFTEVVKK